MNDVCDHSSNHWFIKVSDLHVRVVRVVGGKRHLAINFWQSLHRYFTVDRSDHHLASLWLDAFDHHQNVAISHLRFHWSTWDSAEESGGLVGDQHFVQINLLRRFAERRLRIACTDTLIVEVEGSIGSNGDLLKMHGIKAGWNANTPPA